MFKATVPEGFWGYLNKQNYQDEANERCFIFLAATYLASTLGYQSSKVISLNK